MLVGGTVNKGNLRVSVLGPLRVEIEGAEVELGGAKQQLVLLALVMANNGVVSTDRLIDLVWGDTPPAKPNVTLRTYVSHLRRSLDPDRATGDRSSLLATRSPGYALELGDDQVDARVLERATSTAREAFAAGDFETAGSDASDALALWRTDHLDVLSDVFQVEAAHLLALRREATNIWHRALLALGRHDEALPSLHALTEAEPADEEACRHLMLALYRSGNAGDAVREANRFRTILADTMGLDPTDALAKLELQILNNDEALLLDTGPASSPSPPAESRSAESPSARPLSPPPVSLAPTGRDDVYSRAVELEAAADQPGRTPIIAVVGEAGIGKTTLLQSIAEHAGHEGRRPVWGRCHDGGQTNTLWPWASILRDLFSELDDARLIETLGHREGEIAALLPELTERLGIVASPGKSALSLLDAIARTVRNLATLEPDVVTTLILEDAHWADAASIRLLEVAEPIWADAPISCYVSWRDTHEMPSELTTALGALGRMSGFERIELSGLDAQALCDLHEKLRGKQVSLDEIRPLFERTQGNPLFVTELLRHGLDQPLSTTLRDAIAERLTQLPALGADSLVAGSLCRDGFTTDVLEAVNDATETEILDIIERALALRLIETHPEAFDRFRFTHALVQEGLVTGISPPRKARLHARLGEFFETREAASELLAHHFLRGHDTEVRGASHALSAATKSTSLHDHTGATELLASGLEAMDRVVPRGEGEVEFERIRVDLMIALGQSHKYSQDVTVTHQIVPQAFDLAASKDLVDEMIIAAFVYAATTQITGRFPGAVGWLGYWCPAGPAIDMFTRCLERIPDDHPYRSFLQVKLGGALYGEHADPERKLKLLTEGLEYVHHLADATLKAHTLNHAIVEVDRDFTAADRAWLANDAIASAQDASLPKAEINGRRSLAMLAIEAGDADEFHHQAALIRRIADASHDEGVAFEANLLPATWALFTGDFDAAEQLIQSTFADFEKLGAAVLDLFGIPFALLLRERGMHDAVTGALKEKVDGYPGPAYATPHALSIAHGGNVDEARRAIAPYDADVISAGGQGVLQFTTPWFFADLVRILGDVDAARVCLSHLEGTADRVVAMNCGQLIFGFASLPLGYLSTMVGDYNEAERHLAHSLDRHAQLGARPPLLRTHVALMELAHHRNQAERVDEHRRAAQALASEMGALEWEIELADARMGPSPA